MTGGGGGGAPVLTEALRRFIGRRRVAHLATADAAAVPQVVPVGFALAAGDVLYTAVDHKPKGAGPLKRLRNIAANPAVAVVLDHYEEDWRRIGWVMLRGRAEVLDDGNGAAERDAAHSLLRARYPQYGDAPLGAVIAVRIAAARSWGRLDVADDASAG